LLGTARLNTELLKSREELERVVTERTAKLQELVTELEHFSYTITHDMRAPLRSMIGFAEIMAEECGGGGGRTRRQRDFWPASGLQRAGWMR
jgi:signal transduction histidine kinase